MRSSTAFEAIHDPEDPAWAGHAPAAGVDGRRRAARLAGAVAVAVLVTVAVVGASSSRESGAPPATEQTRAATPGSRDDATVVVPTTPSTAPNPNVAPVAAPTAPSSTASSNTPTAALGSGWAPVVATLPLEATGSGLVRGDLSGMQPQLYQRLDALAVAIDRPISIVSGWRARHEQEQLYQQFLGGTGNLAAVPGTSNHESGAAADAYIAGVALADVSGVREQALVLGLHFPVGGESWHVEMS